MNKEKSLKELMQEAAQLSWKLTYETIAPDNTYLHPRQSLPTSDENQNKISGWADGLYHKYYNDRATGRCSFSARINFDVEKFENEVKDDIQMMQGLLKIVPAIRKLSFDEMKALGYRGSWAGENS